jgi:hypothetical protein
LSETSCPIEIEAFESADQRGNGRKMPEFSPGRSTPVGLPTPNALAPSYSRRGPSRSPTRMIPTLDECSKTPASVSAP